MLAAALAAPGAVAQPTPPVITEPDWAELPSSEALAENYPKIGLLLDLEGYAQIACAVTVQGRLTDCTIDAETPRDMGFGAAAKRMSTAFRMKPQTVDGQPVAGGTVRIPIRFTLPGTPPPKQRPTAQAMKLGLDIADTMQAARGFRAAMEDQVVEMAADGVAPLESRTAAAAALREVIARQTDADLRLAIARSMAETYAVEDLSRLAVFLKSPGGRILQRSEALERSMASLESEAPLVLMSAWRKAACERRACRPTAEEGQAIGAPGLTPHSVWTATPDRAAVTGAIPPLARLLSVEGAVRLGCGGAVDGRLVNCRVEAEAPRGWGLGEAALRLTETYRAPEGKAGRRVLRIDFPAQPLFSPPPASSLKAPAGARTAAREIIDAFDPLSQLNAQLEPQLRLLSATLAAGHDAETASLLTETLRVALQATFDHVMNLAADALASEYSEGDLAEAARFLSSPTGRSLARPHQADAPPAIARLSAKVAAEAREIYCKSRDCTPPRANRP